MDLPRWSRAASAPALGPVARFAEANMAVNLPSTAANESLPLALQHSVYPTVLKSSHVLSGAGRLRAGRLGGARNTLPVTAMTGGAPAGVKVPPPPVTNRLVGAAAPVVAAPWLKIRLPAAVRLHS